MALVFTQAYEKAPASSAKSPVFRRLSSDFNFITKYKEISENDTQYISDRGYLNNPGQKMIRSARVAHLCIRLVVLPVISLYMVRKI